jgi:hypothetical protein
MPTAGNEAVRTNKLYFVILIDADERTSVDFPCCWVSGEIGFVDYWVNLIWKTRRTERLAISAAATLPHLVLNHQADGCVLFLAVVAN